MPELVLWVMSFASVGVMLASATALAFLITRAAVKATMRALSAPPSANSKNAGASGGSSGV